MTAVGGPDCQTAASMQRAGGASDCSYTGKVPLLLLLKLSSKAGGGGTSKTEPLLEAEPQFMWEESETWLLCVSRVHGKVHDHTPESRSTPVLPRGLQYSTGGEKTKTEKQKQNPHDPANHSETPEAVRGASTSGMAVASMVQMTCFSEQ